VAIVPVQACPTLADPACRAFEVTLSDAAKATTAVRAVTAITSRIANLRVGRLIVMKSPGSRGVLGEPTIKHLTTVITTMALATVYDFCQSIGS
jgi:hypothetical protein